MAIAIAAQKMDTVIRNLRSGDVDSLINALDELKSPNIEDRDGNSPLHMVLLNPHINHHSKLLEAVVGELLQTGCDVFKENNAGQTPRQLAEEMVRAEAISDRQYGAVNTVIMRLSEFERQVMTPSQLAEKEKQTEAERPQRSSPNVEWVERIMRTRGAEESRAR